jgi:hypothetical protein
MGDVLLVVVVIVGACTLALATIILIRLSRIAAPQPLTTDIVS